MDVHAKLNYPRCLASDEYYRLFDSMRVEDPVHWTASPDGRGYWSVFRHADIKRILNEPEVFSSERAGVMPIIDDAMATPFLPKALANGEARTKELIGEIFDQLPAHGEIDLVSDLAVRIPMAVICDILKRPREDSESLLGWGKMAIGGTDPEYQQGSAAETVSGGFRPMFEHSLRRSDERRGCPSTYPIACSASLRTAARLRVIASIKPVPGRSRPLSA